MTNIPVSLETDIVVVGAGGCGLTAALAAAEQGKHVLLLERGAQVGGSTAMSAGIFVAAASRLQTANGESGTADELAADILRMNQHTSDPVLTQALCQISGQLMDWLETYGVPMEHMAAYRYPGMSRSWIHSPPERNGNAIITALEARARRHPTVDLRDLTPVTGLVSREGRVCGVTATRADGARLTVSASAVILAASGFGANSKLVARHIPGMANAAYYGTPYATGDAIRWGKRCGGEAACMGNYQAHSSIAFPDMMLVTTYLINNGAFQVNQQGHRFGNETETYAGHALAVQAQPGGTVIEVFDEHILLRTIREYPRFSECLDAGIVLKAETIEELAHCFDIDAENLTATTTRYNAAVRAGQDEFGRDHAGERLKAPFYGIRVTSALIQTLGGLRVDGHGQVLRTGGTPVRGLYAGGGSAVGIAGDQAEGYLAGTGLLAAFGLGLLAGRHAARLNQIGA